MNDDGLQHTGESERSTSGAANALPVRGGAVTAPVIGSAPPEPGDELQAALHENAQLKRQLARATDELESFTYSVSHDLRASLRHISAFVEIVNEDLGAGVDTELGEGLHSDISSHLATITGAARHMTLMIDALMELSRLGRVELNLSRVEVRPLIDEVCQALLPKAQAGSNEGQASATEGQVGSSKAQAHPIQWRIADDFPPLHADPVLVRQILQYLLSNAIKFTRQAAGRAPVEIEIGWRLPPAGTLVNEAIDREVRDGVVQQDPLCELFIKDNGGGFNPRFGGKLFGVFQRLHSASEFEGIGMGLALCRKIVERHGGSINAVSPVFSPLNVPAQVVGGCELRFTLPVGMAGNILNT